MNWLKLIINTSATQLESIIYGYMSLLLISMPCRTECSAKRYACLIIINFTCILHNLSSGSNLGALLYRSWIDLISNYKLHAGIVRYFRPTHTRQLGRKLYCKSLISVSDFWPATRIVITGLVEFDFGIGNIFVVQCWKKHIVEELLGMWTLIVNRRCCVGGPSVVGLWTIAEFWRAS